MCCDNIDMSFCISFRSICHLSFTWFAVRWWFVTVTGEGFLIFLWFIILSKNFLLGHRAVAECIIYRTRMINMQFGSYLPFLTFKRKTSQTLHVGETSRIVSLHVTCSRVMKMTVSIWRSNNSIYLLTVKMTVSFWRIITVLTYWRWIINALVQL